MDGDLVVAAMKAVKQGAAAVAGHEAPAIEEGFDRTKRLPKVGVVIGSGNGGLHLARASIGGPMRIETAILAAAKRCPEQPRHVRGLRAGYRQDYPDDPDGRDDCFPEPQADLML